MIFNQHYDLVDKHAFLSASSYHWVNYDEEGLKRKVRTSLAAQRGTDLHNLAKDLIRLGVKLPKSSKHLNNYVNDAIGFRMVPEQVLMYTYEAFGTADAIGFRDGVLRIFDLKTGENPCKMTQLEIYAAYFCLEYDVNPHDIHIELRLYQNDATEIHSPTAEHIESIMLKTVDSVNKVREFRGELAA